jgi:hypothetical protein
LSYGTAIPGLNLSRDVNYSALFFYISLWRQIPEYFL